MSRPLHAVLLPPDATEHILAAVAAALDGTGPAILPLDPALPPARLAALLAAFAPSAVQTPAGTERTTPSPSNPGQPPGVRADVAVVIATSGSTGEPKGVELTAAALLASARASLARIGAGPGQRWLACLPAFHVAGLQVLVRSLVAGTEPVATARLTADVVAASGCAHVSLVPTQLRRLIDAGAPLAALDTILLGGASVPAGLVDEAAAAGARVVTTYGMTETCGGCVYDGRALDGVSVDVAGDGRISLAGPVLFAGYRLRPDLTAAALDHGWFRTSDLGAMDATGRLVVRGRADDVITTGGEKVVPGDVEAALLSAPGVRDAVVVGLPDQEWGELVTAFIVGEDQSRPPGLEQLRAHVRASLPAYAAPGRVVAIPAIPLLPSGKPDRAALRGLISRG
jgi:O-succinylbenzoic acid--CoA ligase